MRLNISRKVVSTVCFLVGVCFSHGSVVLQFAVGALRNSEGGIVEEGTLWALVLSPANQPLLGGLNPNSSLSAENQSKIRRDFGGSTIAPGADLDGATILRTGQTNSFGDAEVSITLADVDYQTIAAGDLISLYWFPGISAATHVLPESDFSIGGLQETAPDPNSNSGSGGMIVPTNGGQILRVFYFDADFTGSSDSLPVERFTAINVPPSGYQIWRDIKFNQSQIDLGDADPTADPDKDGTPNLLEYATSGEPLIANASPLTISLGSGSYTLGFNRIADPELIYRIEATSDLAASSWPVIFESTGSENVEELIQIIYSLDGDKQFFRFNVTPVVDPIF